jgi:hypothetical protein
LERDQGGALSQRGFRKGAPSDHGAGSGPRPAQETTALTLRLDTGQHRFYCGIDVHARLLAVCVLDQAGAVVRRRQLPAEPQALLDALAPFRPDVVVAVACLFAWYWVADLCRRAGIPFVRGHALDMRLIHSGKTKNDGLDAEKIGWRLRGGNSPQAYVSPKGLRATRDLLRRRH